MRRLLFPLIILLTSYCYAVNKSTASLQVVVNPAPNQQINIPLTVQEAIWPGAQTTGIARSSDHVTVGVPIPVGSGITSVSQLGLSGASVGQFRVLGRWSTNEIKWVLVDTQATLPAGGKTTITLTGGSGNFGGPNMATDNGATITVNTGAAIFTILKKNFNVVDSVVVGGKTLIASGTSMGHVVVGPAYPATDCPCNVVYSSSSDSNSTAVIMENGPAKVVIKATGSHVDAISGNYYTKFTDYLTFYLGQSGFDLQPILRNADKSTAAKGDWYSATKGFKSFDIRLTPNIQSGRSFNIGTNTQSSVSGPLMSGDDAHLYIAYMNNMEADDWNANNCVGTEQDVDRCVASYIARTGSQKAGYTYAQDGYEILHNNVVVAAGDHTKYPQGWADVVDSSGAGMLIGVYKASAYWPKTLQLVNGGNEIRAGLWPDQSMFSKGGGQSNYMPWPAYSEHNVYFYFHSVGLVSPSNTFLAYQHHLLARAPITAYNKAKVFPLPMLDPAVEDQWQKANGVDCCLLDMSPRIWRHYDWPGPGAGNQHDMRYSWLLNWLQRGYVGRYESAEGFYRMVVEHSFPRADGFTFYINYPISLEDYRGFPVVPSANLGKSVRDFIDGQHAHWYGMTAFYNMTGDWATYDQLEDGVKAKFLNAASKVDTGKAEATRDVAEIMLAGARLINFYRQISDNDAAGIQSVVENVMSLQVLPELNVSGYGIGNPVPGGSQGISRARGIHYGCCATTTDPPNYSGRVEVPFQSAILEEGMFEISKELGPSWKYYTLTTDLMYGNSQWALQDGEAYGCSQPPSMMTCGFSYEIYLDMPNNNLSYYQNPGAGQTFWWDFYTPAFYAGDTSWSQKFIWMLQRTSKGTGVSNWAELDSHIMEPAMGALVDPQEFLPAGQLMTVPTQVTSNGNGSYTLSFTTPIGAQSFRLKSYPGKTIVDWVGFNAGTGQFIGDPTTTWPWFACNEVTGLPIPKAGPQQITVNGFDPTKTFNFMLKAWVTP